MFHFVKTHAFFYAVKLGSSFINSDMFKILINKKCILSRYFLQRIITQYGKYDYFLLELKQKKIDQDNLWSNNISLNTFTTLLNISTTVYNENELYLKSNDLEYFHFLTGGNKNINEAIFIIEKNYEKIKNLILKYKFIPFPSRPFYYKQNKLAIYEYPAKDGYENEQQLNMIARAIIIKHDLVNIWKQIGYNDICNDYNSLVIKATLVIEFLQNNDNNIIQKSINAKNKLDDLISIGFNINYKTIIDVFVTFEENLNINNIGKSIIDIFFSLSKDDKYTFFFSCFNESLFHYNNFKSIDFWEFLYNEMINNNIILDNFHHKLHLIIDYHFDLKKIYSNKFKIYTRLSIKFYEWILRFSSDQNYNLILKKCFDDLLKSCITINNVKGKDEEEIDILIKYCRKNNYFLSTQLYYLKILFDFILPKFFNIDISFLDNEFGLTDIKFNISTKDEWYLTIETIYKTFNTKKDSKKNTKFYEYIYDLFNKIQYKYV